MIFTAQPVVQQVPCSAIMSGTSTTAVYWKGQIYLFYSSAENNGAWYATSPDGVTWSDIQSVSARLPPKSTPGMYFMAATSPSAVVWNDQLYLFYTGSGNDGIWYTTTVDGKNWTAVQSVTDLIPSTSDPTMSVMAATSPSAVVWNGQIYLFYTGSGNDGIWYTTTSNNTNWTAVQSVTKLISPASNPTMSVMAATSPSAVVWNGQIYLFYTGSGNNGIWYTTITDPLNQLWSDVKSLQAQLPGMIVQANTGVSPVSANGPLYVFYTADTGLGVWYTTTSDGNNWSDVRPVDDTSGSLRGTSGTTPLALNCDIYGADDNFLFVFWSGSQPVNQWLWVYRNIVEVQVGLSTSAGQTNWTWSGVNSAAKTQGGMLVLNELGRTDEYAFQLSDQTGFTYDSVELSLQRDDSPPVAAGSVTVEVSPEQTQQVLSRDDFSAKIGATLSEKQLALNITNLSAPTGYYICVILEVTLDGVVYRSPDPQIVLKPTTTSPLSHD